MGRHNSIVQVDSDTYALGYSDENELLVYKSVFSTCNLKKKKCRGWEIQTDEFKHDKKKRIFEYKDFLLKNLEVFDRVIFILKDSRISKGTFSY